MIRWPSLAAATPPVMPESLSVDMWVRRGGSAEFGLGGYKHEGEIKASINITHNNSMVFASSWAANSGDAFVGAIATIEATIGQGWREWTPK